MIKKEEDKPYLNMDMSQSEYLEHCAKQRRKRVLCMNKSISEIRNMTAQQLLKHCGQENRIPVDLNAILEKLDMSCLPFDFSEMEKELAKENSNERILGALVTRDDHAAIFYRSDNDVDSHRYRFTIAHELAHCCLAHYDISNVSVHLRLEGDPQDEQERAANVFAGELLIPENNLMDVISRLMLPSLLTLTDIFEVSSNVMKARLDHLKISHRILGYNY